MRSGAYVTTDESKAARFKKDADTIGSTGKLVRDIFGELRIADATSQDWTRLNETVRRLPTNHGRSSRLRELTCVELIKRTDNSEKRQKRAAEHKIGKERLSPDQAELARAQARIPRLAPRTFQRHQKYLSAPLDHAVMMGRLPHNPFKSYVMGERSINELRKGQAETARQIWTSEDQAELLKTEKWSSPKTMIDDAIYWLPIIARLSGLRSEEMLQLKPENIRCDEGIHYFDIARGTGQSLKSESARRMVPVHSQLIELGFLELVEVQRKRGRVRIFDSISRRTHLSNGQEPRSESPLAARRMMMRPDHCAVDPLKLVGRNSGVVKPSRISSQRPARVQRRNWR